MGTTDRDKRVEIVVIRRLRQRIVQLKLFVAVVDPAESDGIVAHDNLVEQLIEAVKSERCRLEASDEQCRHRTRRDRQREDDDNDEHHHKAFLNMSVFERKLVPGSFARCDRHVRQ